MKRHKNVWASYCQMLSIIVVTQAQADVRILPESSHLEFPKTAFKTLHSLQNHSQKTSSLIHDVDKYKFPIVIELTNRHGIRSLFVARSELAMVDVQLSFNAGSARDAEIAADAAGLAAVSAQLLQQGTSRLSALDLSQQLSAVGAQLSSMAYRDMYVVRLRCPNHPEQLHKAVTLMTDVIREAEFNFTSPKQRRNWQNSPERLPTPNANQLQAEALLYASLYGQHPYATPIQGTIRSNTQISTRLLKRFQARFLVAKNMNIAITGQLNVAQAQALSQSIINALPMGQAANALPVAQPPSSLQIRHLRSRTNQATVLWGQLAIARNDPDYAALQLANQMLGDNGFESLLMRRLRQQLAYTYGVSSRFNALQSTGNWQIEYATSDHQLVPSMLQLQHILKQEFKASLNLKNLAQQKQNMLRQFSLQYASNAALNAELGLIGFYHEPSNALQQFAQQIEALKLQDVQQALDRHLRPNRAVWVVQSTDLDEAKLRLALEQTADNQP